MVEFIEQNQILASYHKTDTNDIVVINEKWNDLKNILNSNNLGRAKTDKEWRRVFSELKTNTKRRVRELKLQLTGTGGGNVKTKALTDLEERVLNMISEISVLGAPGLVEPGLQNILNEAAVDTRQMEVVLEDGREGNPEIAMPRTVENTQRPINRGKLKTLRTPRTSSNSVVKNFIETNAANTVALTSAISSLAVSIHALCYNYLNHY